MSDVESARERVQELGVLIERYKQERSDLMSTYCLDSYGNSWCPTCMSLLVNVRDREQKLKHADWCTRTVPL